LILLLLSISLTVFLFWLQLKSSKGRILSSAENQGFVIMFSHTFSLLSHILVAIPKAKSAVV
jgi:hypothetical protein